MSIEPIAVPVDTWDLFTPSDDRERFTACSACDRSIEEEAPRYVIERAFTRTAPGEPAEIAYEFAVCESCLADQDASYSPDSQEHIAQFYSDVIDLNVRGEQLLSTVEDEGTPDIGTWMDRCAVTGTPVADATYFRVMAYAFGRWLLLAGMPAVLTRPALERLEGGLSNTTRERALAFAEADLAVPSDASGIPPAI